MIHLTFDYKSDKDCATSGQYLRYHRKLKGMSTKELAEKVGIVPATLVLYENDKRPIQYNAAIALADALGIERHRLLDTYAAFVGYPCSKLLQTVRAELSISQMQFAEKIGVSQTAYSSWERGSRIPRRKEYEKIIMALKESGTGIAPYLSKQISA